MTWIAVHVAGEGPGPLSLPERPGSGGLLDRGGLMLSALVERPEVPVNLMRYAVRDPGPAAQILRLDPDGALRLLARQGERVADTRLALDLPAGAVRLRVACGWDGAEGWLAAHLPEEGRTAVAALRAVVPPNGADLRQMGRVGPALRLAPGVEWFGIGSEPVPGGALPGLGPQSRVRMPEGERPVHAIRAGDPVLMAEGAVARVLWAGAADLPAQGEAAPVLLRAPFWGLKADVLVAAGQRLRLAGSDVDYLFGTDQVLVVAADLIDGRRAILADGIRSVRWHGLVLDRPGAVSVGGLAVEAFDPGRVEGPEALARHVLGGMIAGAMPPALRVLKDFEARALCRMRAA